MQSKLTEEQWRQFEDQGYVNIGRMEADQLKALQDRIDDIMQGKAAVEYDKLLMQLESAGGAYHNTGGQTLGFKGASLNYRKIQNLEIDPVFRSYLGRPIFQDICRRAYGSDVPIALFRAMFFNKPARTGSLLPWHQDRWNTLSRDPIITIWAAMDPATIENGCLQVIPGSHRRLINPSNHSGFLTKPQSEEICTPDKIRFLELEPGEILLLHNYLLHSSDRNASAQSRRAFSVCYMDARTLEDGQPGSWPAAFAA